MAAPRSSATQFTSDWNKAMAWAESQGIGASAYLPVYQLDLSRVKQGSYPLSAAERNREILASATPNNVTPSTRTSPDPSNVLHNAMNTARNLFTGLIHLPQELWHTADNTLHAIEHPASLQAKTPGATIGNWMNDTLLSLIPGVSDVGTLLQKGWGAGLSTLAEHPVLSALDLMPGSDGGGLLDRFARTGEVSEDAVRNSLLGRAASKLGSIPTGRPGVTMAGKPVESMSIADTIQRIAARVGPGGAGVGPELSKLGEVVNQTSMMAQNLYGWLFDAPNRVLSQLNDKELSQVRNILDTRQADGGNRMMAALDSADTPPLVKEAVLSALQGPQRFAVEEAIFSGGLKGVETLDGKTRYYSKPNIKEIDKAAKAKTAAEKSAEKVLADRLGRPAGVLNDLEKMLPQATQQFLGAVTKARQAVAQDAGISGNITQDVANPTRYRSKRGISKSAQVQAVIGEGGLADDFVKEIRKTHDPAQVKILADAMKSRLSKWGPRSVDAADVPALAELYQITDAFSRWSDAYTKESRSIDEAIHGELDAQRHFQGERGRYGQAKTRLLRDRQATERQNLADRTAQVRRTARERFAARQSQLNDTATSLIAGMVDEAEGRAEHLTGKAVDRDIMPKLNADIMRTRRMLKEALSTERKDYLAQDAVRRAERQRDAARMARRHEEERQSLKKDVAGEKAGMGDVVKELEGWAKAVDGYQQAIYDHPADQFRDAMLVLFQKHLMAHEHTAHLVEQTERHVEQVRPDQVASLRNDPKLLSEYMVFAFRDVFGDPRLDPQVAKDAERYMKEAWKSADGELKTLIAQGFEVPYIPASTSADVLLGRDAIKPLIGKGVPKGDIAKARVWDFTPQTGDFAVGINKAVVQALQRSATVEMMEHYIRPMAMTGDEMREFVTRVKGVGGGERGGNLPLRYLDVARHDMQMETINPEALFGFAMPRWGKGELWLPKPVVKALEQIANERRGSLAKLTKVFRYSILGLSPRYDAHVIFGGTMMAALRSSPHALGMIGQAWKAVRDGTLPEIPGHAAIEEGFDDTVLRMWHQQGGQEMGKMAIAEHVERVQGIAKAAAKPVHMLKAVADLNFRFTRYVRDIQGAVVYLDGAAKAERYARKIAVEDPETGKMMELSPQRAMEAGMRHVEQVFGNLGKMSPFERKVAQSIMPFYAWQKHILSYVLRFPFDHPWRSVVLAQLADRASESVPASWPVRLELLFFLGSPSSTGTVNAIDLRSLDPFRTTANYFSLTGWLEALNPALMAPMAMVDPNIVYGGNVLYPGVTYTAFYGEEVAGAAGNIKTAAEQIIPQIGGVGSLITLALNKANDVRTLWGTDRSAAIKQLLDNMNIPFVTPPVNLKQVAAKGEAARYRVAKTLAYTAFQSGTFKPIASYRTVPNPLNPDYDISPAALESLYSLAQEQNPTVPPIESVLPPPTPFGY